MARFLLHVLLTLNSLILNNAFLCVFSQIEIWKSPLF
jgi:hypothetical protein